MMNLLLFLFGNVTVCASYKSAAEILNLCMYYGITFARLDTNSEGIRLRFRLSEFLRFEKTACAKNIEYSVCEKKGLPFIFLRYKHRYGIALGFLLAIGIVVAAHSYVWSIEVEGNTTLTSAEVRDMLEDQGFFVGARIGDANTDRIENKIMIESDRISWMSINIIGTVAHVQIREYSSKGQNENVTKPANLIASKAGLVEEVRLFRGNAVVAAGKYVEKGELLVSGLFDSIPLGFRYTRAAGQVLARTEEEFCIEIPYEYEQKVYTGEQFYEKSLNFFDFSINISKKYSKNESFYDKIDIVEDFSLFGLKTPLSYRQLTYLEYETVTSMRSREQAEELAYYELERIFAEMATDRIIIKKTVRPTVAESSFILVCSVVSIENIAEVSEFEVDLSYPR